MSNRAPRYRALATFLIAAIASAGIWALSPILAGHDEPWDAGNFYYHVALLAAGAIAGILAPRPTTVMYPVAIYLGAVVGQAVYEAAVIGIGPLFPLGVVFLLAYSLEFLAAAVVAGFVRRAVKRETEAR